MFYVYRLQSIPFPGRTYVGFSANLKARLLAHNQGKNRFTAPFRPWKLIFYCAFQDEQTARCFEAYLKSGSGKAFGNKHLW